MKKLISLILVLIMLVSMSAVSLAAGVTYKDVGNAANILVIKKPENAQSQSNKSVYPVSGVANPGCTVTVLTYNSEDGLYYPKQDNEGKVLQTTVGASGLFCFNVQLSSGDNNLAVQAVTEDNTRVQRVFFKINLVSLGWYNSIKSLINGWIK
ncbi:MAG: hypothetical protein IJD97_06070 [Clostridia bacterium]|nr:hypothetical protein [Clostridia bacterium]